MCESPGRRPINGDCLIPTSKHIHTLSLFSLSPLLLSLFVLLLLLSPKPWFSTICTTLPFHFTLTLLSVRGLPQEFPIRKQFSAVFSGGEQVHRGNIISATAASERPASLMFNAEPGVLWTVAMMSPDARLDGKDGQVLHWLR